MNPKSNTIDENEFNIYLTYKNMSFDNKWKALDKDEKLKKIYFEQQDGYENINPGNYFRNNVWWWRPLWHYVCNSCDDILTEEDIEGGASNSGHKINADKALEIGVRLHTAVLDGSVQEWKDGYDKETGEPNSDRKNKMGMQYVEIIPVLVKAIQELSAKVTALENA